VASVSSLTKAYGFGTVRFGWLIGARALVARAVRYHDYVAVLYPTPSAVVGVRALEHLPALSARAVAARERGLPIVSEFVAARQLRWHPSEAGVIALIELPAGVAAPAFCAKLEQERQTVLVPGDFFEAPGTVRIGFGCEEPVLREGLARFGAALDEAAPVPA
jgi:aspartate/methionine/tyrosine aminotransferase